MKFFELETQRKIYNLIEKNPGIQAQKIASLLSLQRSDVERHLDTMEKDGLLQSTFEAGYKHYYVKAFRTSLRAKRMMKTRRQIYETIEENPGIHLSKIAQDLNTRISLVEYHVQHLEKEGLVNVMKEKGYKRFYTGNIKAGVQEKKILSLLRQEYPLKIIIFLLKHPHARHKDIAEHLGLSTSKLTYHLNKLVNFNIVSTPGIGDNQGYSLVNKNEIIDLLRKFQFHTVVERFTETWDEFY